MKNHSNRFAAKAVMVLCSLSIASNAYGQLVPLPAAQAAIAAIGPATASAAGAVVTGGALRAPCASPNGVACMMMGLAAAQALASLLNAQGSRDSRNALSQGSYIDPVTGVVVTATPPATLTGGTGTGGGGGDSGTGTVSLTDRTLGELTRESEILRNAATRAGVTVSADGSTVKDKNGKSYPASAFGSASAMKDAGFSSSDIANVQDALSNVAPKIEARLKGLAAMMNDAGGGGGAKASGESYDSGGGGSGGYGDSFAAAKGKSALNDKGVAGMSKKLGDDNIGVSGDNIFEMVTRRYQARDKANSFLKD